MLTVNLIQAGQEHRVEMARYCNPLCMFIFRLVYSGVGVIVGLSVCAAFTVHFHNRHAAFWGLSSAFLAAMCVAQFIYLYIVKERLRRPPNAIVLTVVGVIGAIGIGVGTAGFVAYLGLGIIQSINNQVESLVTSNYIVCVWSFAVFKWAVTAYVYSMISFKYLKKVPKGFQRMPQEDDDVQDVEDQDKVEYAIET